MNYSFRQVYVKKLGIVEAIIYFAEKLNIMNKHTYPGNKGLPNLLPNILNEIPAHTVYWELFAGSAQVFEAKKPANENFLVEIEPGQVEQLKITTRSRAVVISCPAAKILALLSSAGVDHFVFLDPPYLPETRPNSLKLYKNELSREDHLLMLKQLGQLKCPTMITHYDSPVYDDILKGWRKKVIRVNYHGHIRHEAIYMNYPAGEKLHEVGAVGYNKTDRQRIKRKAAGWVQRFKNLPLQERQAITAQLAREGIFIYPLDADDLKISGS